MEHYLTHRCTHVRLLMFPKPSKEVTWKKASISFVKLGSPPFWLIFSSAYRFMRYLCPWPLFPNQSWMDCFYSWVFPDCTETNFLRECFSFSLSRYFKKKLLIINIKINIYNQINFQDAYPPNHYVRRVPQRQIHIFTLCQFVQLIILALIGFYPYPYLKMIFPIIILLLMPIRHMIIPKIVPEKYLRAMDEAE